MLRTLTQAVVVIAAFVAVGLPHQGGPGVTDGVIVRAWGVIANSGSTIVTADIGGEAGTGVAAEAPATVGSEPLANPIALLKGGGPLANGVPISIVLITGLGLMIGATLFKVARLSSGS